MATDVNTVSITGNLTRDPELKHSQSGMAVMKLGVAVNERRKNGQTGEWEDHANFVDCTMFGKRAEGVEPYLAKGTPVAVSGKLRYDTWESDGQKRSKLGVIVEELRFFGGKRKREEAEDEPQDDGGAYDEDIPF